VLACNNAISFIVSKPAIAPFLVPPHSEILAHEPPADALSPIKPLYSLVHVKQRKYFSSHKSMGEASFLTANDNFPNMLNELSTTDSLNTDHECHRLLKSLFIHSDKVVWNGMAIFRLKVH
jgi:hypothetical protein